MIDNKSVKRSIVRTYGLAVELTRADGWADGLKLWLVVNQMCRERLYHSAMLIAFKNAFIFTPAGEFATFSFTRCVCDGDGCERSGVCVYKKNIACTNCKLQSASRTAGAV